MTPPEPPSPPWEQRRQAAQAELDAARDARARNRLGQFATPPALARALVRLGLQTLPAETPIRFLDPSIGAGALYSALLSERGVRPIQDALGVELDPLALGVARDLWANTPLRLIPGDFTALPPPSPDDAATLIVANPPYVRHHHLSGEDKARLKERLLTQTGTQRSGLSGLYVDLLLLSLDWMAPGGVGVWLIPSELLDVGYAAAARRLLSERVTLHRVHRMSPDAPQFGDAVVSSAVLLFENRPPPADHHVAFTYGDIEHPTQTRLVPLAALRAAPRWRRELTDAPSQAGTPLGELFLIRRGVATGGNKLFVLREEQVERLQIPQTFLSPLLPSPRHLLTDRVESGPDGAPALADRRWLIRCDLPPETLAEACPALWRHLQTGIPSVSTGYLCRHRSPWYSQERRAPAPIVCTYMSRAAKGRPFRFILNRSQAIAANVYLMLHPKPALSERMQDNPGLIERIWAALNALSAEALTHEARVYGGGLYKLEPKELGAVRVKISTI
ncbi:SAM-dependent DNA methyltransferase [Myxococcota bacterium]|nr:SAM-dependent DNA methyltransferase [Myxococcota bacterium]